MSIQSTWSDTIYTALKDALTRYVGSTEDSVSQRRFAELHRFKVTAADGSAQMMIEYKRSILNIPIQVLLSVRSLLTTPIGLFVTVRHLSDKNGRCYICKSLIMREVWFCI